MGGRVAELCRVWQGLLVVFALASAVFQIFLFRCFAQLALLTALLLGEEVSPTMKVECALLTAAMLLPWRSGQADVTICNLNAVRPRSFRGHRTSMWFFLTGQSGAMLN